MENGKPVFLEEEEIDSKISNAGVALKAEILAELRNTEPPANYDPSALTVYFYNGALVGVGAGLLENQPFLAFNQATPQLFADFFEADEFSVIEEDFKDKAGNVCYDSNGNPLKVYKTKLYSHPFMHGKGTTAGGDEYEYFSIGKHGATLNGYRIHEAFGYAHDVGGSYKGYILLDTYQSSKVIDRDGITRIGSFRGGYPLAEIGVPETYIHPYRGYMEQGLRWEMQWLDILEAVCMGRRGEGWQSSASELLADHFCGDAKDIDGTSITTANEASNSFSVANSNAYAGLAIGAKVSFDSVTNVYGARDGSTVITRTITAKSVGDSSTTFTFDGDAVNVYGRYLHTSYMAQTGCTDGLTGICAYDANCPIGYQPFKLFNVEKPWGAHAYWLDWIRVQGNQQIGICVPNNSSTVDSYSWVQYAFYGMSMDENWVKEYKDFYVPSVVLPSSAYAGDASNYYATKQYWRTGSSFVIFSGRNNSNNFKHGGQFSLCSEANIYAAWSGIGDASLSFGDWGRTFRGVR